MLFTRIMPFSGFVRQSIHPSIETILSPQLLQFSRDFDETYQLLFPWPEDDQILSRSCSTDFTRVIALWQFFNSKSCLSNFSCSFQWILVKPSSYCCHDLKRIILYQNQAWLLFFQSYGPSTVLVVLSICPSVRRHNLVSAIPPSVFKGFWWNFPVIVLMSWRWSYFSRFQVIALWQFFNSKSCLCNSSCSFQWILVKRSSYCCHDLKRVIF